MRWMIVCAALLAAGCGTAGPLAARHTVVESQAYPEPLSRIVFTDLGSAGVTVRASSGPTASVEREMRWRGDKRPEVTETVDGQTLRVSYKCLTPNCSVDYDVHVPATVEVHAETTSGNVDVHGISGAVVIRTTSGDIAITVPPGMSYAVQVRTTSGHRRVAIAQSASATGEIHVESKSGDVTIGYGRARSAGSGGTPSPS
jgi:hypothetical protein